VRTCTHEHMIVCVWWWW